MSGTPGRTGLEILTSRSPLTADEWLELVEARRQLIKPHLERFTMATLGGLECVESEGGAQHELSIDAPKVEGDESSLDIQGMFRESHDAHRRDRGRPGQWIPTSDWIGGQKVIWGLTRNARWLIAKIDYKRQLGYKERGRSHAQTVHIRYVALPELLQEAKSTPVYVWRALEETVRQFAEHRRRLYEAALALSQQVALEAEIVDQIWQNNLPAAAPAQAALQES